MQHQSVTQELTYHRQIGRETTADSPAGADVFFRRWPDDWPVKLAALANTLRFNRNDLRALTLSELSFLTAAQVDYVAEVESQRTLLS